MHHAKPHRKGSKYNVMNAAVTINPDHYVFIQFPAESPVQPGDMVQYVDEDSQTLTGTVIADGAYLSNERIHVRVKFPDCVDALPVDVLLKVFDYAALDAETRIVVQQKTGEIKERMRRAAQDIIDIGARLMEVKDKLGHGNFGKWLSAEFEWDERQAQRMMNVTAAFKSDNLSDLKIGASALYLLAAPSTPETAREVAIQRAQNGQPVTYSAAKQIVAAVKQPAPSTPAITRPPGTAPDISNVTGQANQLFGQKPAPVTYGRREDDGYQDDVPSVHVDDEPTPADVRAAVIEQIRSDLDQVQDADARERLAAIVTRHEREQEDRAQRKAAWQEHENRRLLAAQTPPPEGQYRTIVVDPPWPMKRIEREVRPNQREYLDYPTMRLRDIKALDVQSLAAEDGCHLYLWTTHKFLPDALEITKEWGFRYNCLLTWEKNTGMTPYHFRFNTELVIFATRGSMAVQRKGLPLCFRGEAGGHSTKPDTFFDMVRQASPGPRLEMFARREREGFTVWGNEVTHAAAAAG